MAAQEPNIWEGEGKATVLLSGGANGGRGWDSDIWFSTSVFQMGKLRHRPKRITNIKPGAEPNLTPAFSLLRTCREGGWEFGATLNCLEMGGMELRPETLGVQDEPRVVTGGPTGAMQVVLCTGRATGSEAAGIRPRRGGSGQGLKRK